MRRPATAALAALAAARVALSAHGGRLAPLQADLAAAAASCQSLAPSPADCAPLPHGDGCTRAARRLRDMELVRVLPSADDEINAACFHPRAGGGIAYGTKEGRLRTIAHDRSHLCVAPSRRPGLAAPSAEWGWARREPVVCAATGQDDTGVKPLLSDPIQLLPVLAAAPRTMRRGPAAAVWRLAAQAAGPLAAALSPRMSCRRPRGRWTICGSGCLRSSGSGSRRWAAQSCRAPGTLPRLRSTFRPCNSCGSRVHGAEPPAAGLAAGPQLWPFALHSSTFPPLVQPCLGPSPTFHYLCASMLVVLLLAVARRLCALLLHATLSAASPRIWAALYAFTPHANLLPPPAPFPRLNPNVFQIASQQGCNHMRPAWGERKTSGHRARHARQNTLMASLVGARTVWCGLTQQEQHACTATQVGLKPASTAQAGRYSEAKMARHRLPHPLLPHPH